MECPFCHTENREDRERCYHCDKDISMLRLVVNKARHHYNVALEHAERGRIGDAIDELHNALDLDRRFANAHVVLGTLYAKQGDFDKARDAWRAALAVEPELGKAHQYLQRVETVEKSLPAVKRLRLAGLAMLAALTALVISLALMAREPSGTRMVREAQTALQTGDYARALERLTQAQTGSRPGSGPHVAAAALKSALQSEMRQEVRRIQELKYREEYPAVLAAIAELESKRPDELTSAALVNIREDVNHYYVGKLRELFRRYEAGETNYPDFSAQAQEFFKSYPDIPDKREIAAIVERARDMEAARRLDEVKAEYENYGDVGAAIEGLRQAQAEFGGAEAAAEGRDDLVDLILSGMFDDFQRLVSEQDFAAATAQLAAIESFPDEFRDVVDVSGPVDLARGVLTDLWAGARLKEAESLVRSGDPGEAEEALTLLREDVDGLTTPARELVADLERELYRREDAAELEKLRGRRDAILKGKLGDEEATETLAAAERLARRLKKPKERAEALVYAAGAALKAAGRESAENFARRAREEKTLDSELEDALEKLLNPPEDVEKPAPKKKAKRESSEAREGSEPERPPSEAQPPEPTPVPTPKPQIIIEESRQPV